MLTRRFRSFAKLLPTGGLLSLSLLAAGCIFSSDAPETAAPTATAPARPAISRGETAPSPTPQATRPAAPRPQPARGPIEGEVSVVYSFPFIWPAAGPITSFMSPEHPNGIDIGLEDNATMEVRAAAGGTVTEAGGSDDEPLGISIVLDHGNGVTTVYGHLSELLVEAGDEVEIGDVIAVGGSTGISTGNHLHLEVRKDGETVDPLHVLPADEGETVAFAVDCDADPFTLPAGAQALLDFAGVLQDGETVTAAAAEALSDGPALEYTIEGSAQLLLRSPINLHGPDGLDAYKLELTVNGASDNLVGCAFAVEQREVPTTFYVRAFTPTDDPVLIGDDAAAAPTEVPPPTPTATPNPWAKTPDYEVSSPGGAGSRAPNYGAPAGEGAGVQTPSYGVPGATKTPAPTSTPAATATGTPAP